MQADGVTGKLLGIALLVGFVAVAIAVLAGIGSLVILVLPDSDGTADASEAAGAEAAPFNEPAALIDAIEASSLSCVDPETFDSSTSVASQAIDYPLASAVTCTYGYIPLYLFVYAETADRATAMSEGHPDATLCTLQPQSTGWNEVTGANWLIASPFPDIPLDELRDAIDERAALASFTC